MANPQRILALAVVLGAALARPAFGEATEPAGSILRADEIKVEFGGHAFAGYYVDGDTWSETYRADGSLDYREATYRMTGAWSIANGTFCTIYVERATGGCFVVERVSSNCFEFKFVARDPATASVPPSIPAGFDARGWRTDRASTCRPALTS